jgi:hypothetical protein
MTQIYERVALIGLGLISCRVHGWLTPCGARLAGEIGTGTPAETRPRVYLCDRVVDTVTEGRRRGILWYWRCRLA